MSKGEERGTQAQRCKHSLMSDSAEREDRAEIGKGGNLGGESGGKPRFRGLNFCGGTQRTALVMRAPCGTILSSGRAS
jgi:hypothetical protein